MQPIPTASKRVTSQVFEECRMLYEIRLSFFDQLTDISALSRCKNLRSLFLSDCDYIRDLSAFSESKTLEQLTVRYCSHLTDLQAVVESPSLRELRIYKCFGIAGQTTPSNANLRVFEITCCEGKQDHISKKRRWVLFSWAFFCEWHNTICTL